MSDLTATNCGCNDFGSGRSGNNGSCNLLWIILLLSVFNNGNNGCGNGIGLFNNGDNGNNSCDWLILILLFSCFCGNN